MKKLEQEKKDIDENGRHTFTPTLCQASYDIQRHIYISISI